MECELLQSPMISYRSLLYNTTVLYDNMGIRALPDMYALSPWACGPQASGIHIRQNTRAHVITYTYYAIQSVFGSEIFSQYCSIRNVDS